MSPLPAFDNFTPTKGSLGLQQEFRSDETEGTLNPVRASCLRTGGRRIDCSLQRVPESWVQYLRCVL